MNLIKCLIVAVSLALAGGAHAATSTLNLSTSLKLPQVKVVSLKDIITKVTTKIDDKPKVVLVALANVLKNLPKIKHGDNDDNDHHGHHSPPPYGCGSGGGGWGCGCHASKH